LVAGAFFAAAFFYTVGGVGSYTGSLLALRSLLLFGVCPPASTATGSPAFWLEAFFATTGSFLADAAFYFFKDFSLF